MARSLVRANPDWLSVSDVTAAIAYGISTTYALIYAGHFETLQRRENCKIRVSRRSVDAFMVRGRRRGETESSLADGTLKMVGS